jgi:hypothetical protein
MSTPVTTTPSAEQHRLDDHHAHWKKWGPYLSDRAWGTVREDYSPNGDAWQYFPHDHARSRAYRWNEDGLLGMCDAQQYLCFGLALWNGADAILKERLFGLNGPEGNHGEDVKEHYFYTDSTPTHSYMQALYKYPQRAFPYEQLLVNNRQRGAQDREYELFDTGIFADNHYFDVQVEYAKETPDVIAVCITVTNRADTPAECHLLPTLWFRNTWSWGYATSPMNDVSSKPILSLTTSDKSLYTITAQHAVLGTLYCHAQNAQGAWFTENESNRQRLYHSANPSPYVKDAFHRYLINGDTDAINPQKIGTKACFHYHRMLQANETWVIRLQLTPSATPKFADFDAMIMQRQREADEFYAQLQTHISDADMRRVQRQALAGMLWSKQLYYYDIEQWLHGDPQSPPPPRERLNGRNHEWEHLNNFDVISMPDKWEYPWYAGWDLGFHAIPLALVDSYFAKEQMILMTREWYMHPNGQLPAYEWNFGDVNPPVHAWASWRVYEIDAQRNGRKDTHFLKRIFHKLLLNFTWWVNRKDAEGANIFQGGFLGLDNISLFDRSAVLPTGGYINQSDGTAWMAFYCLSMLNIAIELAKDDLAYEDLAIKFYEHFLQIAGAMSGFNRHGMGLWDEGDGFFYDTLRLPNGDTLPLKVRSLVGLMPLIAVETIGQPTLDQLGGFARSLNWMNAHRPHLLGNMMNTEVAGYGNAHIFCIPTQDRLIKVLGYMLDEEEFLSDYGIRSLSKFHQAHPYHLTIGGKTFSVAYEPAESQTGLFGGNSNWRGPIWFPMNYLLIEALRKYHRYYGDALKVPFPTGSQNFLTLAQVSDELSARLAKLFLRDGTGKRAVFGANEQQQNDPAWRDWVLFYEYFHGDTGEGLGASHQTGWTGLIAEMLMTRPIG